jgi:hypothetical protein
MFKSSVTSSRLFHQILMMWSKCCSYNLRLMAAGALRIISLCFPRPNNYRVFARTRRTGKIKAALQSRFLRRGAVPAKCRDSAERRLRVQRVQRLHGSGKIANQKCASSLLGFIVLIAFCANLTLIKQVHAANNNSADQIMAEMCDAGFSVTVFTACTVERQRGFLKMRHVLGNYSPLLWIFGTKQHLPLAFDNCLLLFKQHASCKPNL